MTSSNDLDSELDSDLDLEQKIKIEIRRRTQIYTTLDYFLSNVSYFDFFSRDAFDIVKKARFLSFEIPKENFTSEILLLPFFDSKTEIRKIFDKCNFNAGILEEVLETNKLKPKGFFGGIVKKVLDIFNFATSKKSVKKVSRKKKRTFPNEITSILENAAENALTRFKTPVISSEILFITLMEDEKVKASQIVKKMIQDETAWYLFRYELIKRIHMQESSIRGDVPINQQYFAYLLKTQLSDVQFDRLVETGQLAEGVALFRNTLIASVLRKDFFAVLAEDVRKSMHVTRFRRYSS